MQTILTEGMFVKVENRNKFTESYNTLIKIEEDITVIDFRLSPEGEYGSRYMLANVSSAPSQVKLKKMRAAQDDASLEARGIINRTTSAMVSMINLLNGILRNDESGKFSSLHNLGTLGGKKHKVLIGGITESINQFQQALQLLKEAETAGIA